MTPDAYKALEECARRRVVREWGCTEAERAILLLITELSYGLRQSWAVVPTLSDFAEATGFHKSTISRALRSALKKGFLMFLKRRDETLYAICTSTRAAPSATPENSTQEVARKRLLEINTRRCQGTADVDGQGRLPGILPSEELDAPAAAFEALIEVELAVTEQAPPANVEPVLAAPEEEDIEAKLRRLGDSMERQRTLGEGPPPGRSVPGPLRGSISADAQMSAFCRGLAGEALHAMQRVREECISAGALQEAAFLKWGRLWKQRCTKFPRAYLEAAGAHKAKRLEDGRPADEPGAWIYRTATEILSVQQLT